MPTLTGQVEESASKTEANTKLKFEGSDQQVLEKEDKSVHQTPQVDITNFKSSFYKVEEAEAPVFKLRW